MDDANGVRVPVTHECGHKFEVPIAGKDLESLEFACPACGGTDRFTSDQIATIVAQYNAIRDALQTSIKRAVRGKKHITYRPGRR